MKILITGSKGQLGSELRELSTYYKNLSFTFTDLEELDITNYNALNIFFEKNKFDTIINCAAYTAVDKAETDKENASHLNRNAVKYLAEFASNQNSLLVHISTDYVFDGRNCKPYLETDLTNPKSFYGKSKLDGEVEIIFQSKRAIIIRTSWLYSSYGNNFVKTILKYGKERGKLNVVFDQIGTPTYAADLAFAILEIIPQLNSKLTIDTYHFSNEGVSSWYDFAKEIVELSNMDCIINPIETKDYPLPAPRPHYSVLDKTKIKKEFHIDIPYWKDSLKKCLKLLNE